MSWMKHVPVYLLIASLTAAAGASLRQARATAPSSLEAILEAPTIPSSVKRVLALGFRSLVADFDYLQAIQIFGDRSFSTAPVTEKKVRSLVMARLIEDATELDPEFDYAYIFAANTIPVARPDGTLENLNETTALLRKGLKNGRSDWRIPFYLSYYLSSFQGDFAGAADAMAEAARRPGRPEYVPLLATRLAAAGGSIDLGIQLATAMADQATSDEDREKFLERARLLNMERHIRLLNSAIATFTARDGHPPATLNDLTTAGLLSSLPEEPHGGTYVYDRAAQAVHSSAAARLKLPDTVEKEIQTQLQARQRPAGPETP